MPKKKPVISGKEITKISTIKSIYDNDSILLDFGLESARFKVSELFKIVKVLYFDVIKPSSVKRRKHVYVSINEEKLEDMLKTQRKSMICPKCRCELMIVTEDHDSHAISTNAHCEKCDKFYFIHYCYGCDQETLEEIFSKETCLELRKHVKKRMFM